VKKLLNNKGYMLVEIILASVLAMVVAYFVIDLTIKLKNKNDDLVVKTLVATDQAIIYNTIMRDVFENGMDLFSCDKIVIEDNKFIYNGETISLVSKYADIEYDSSNTDYCNIVDGNLELKIPLNVKQLPGENFDVVVNNESVIGDDSVSTLYTCSRSAYKTTKISCNSSNYSSPSAACAGSGFNYASNNCDKYAYYRWYFKSCSYVSGKYQYVSVGGYQDGNDYCGMGNIPTCNQSSIGTTIVSKCEKLSGDYYRGDITCYYYHCSSGTPKDGKCYLYDQKSCPVGWTSS